MHKVNDTEIKIKTENIYTVSGVLNFNTVPQLREKGNAVIQKQNETTFDFSQVVRSDSAGLALLTAWLRYAKQQDKKVRFINIPKQLADLAQLCNLSGVLHQN